ncbi:thioredoxin family protein [Pseudorhodoplanes sp.]|uniref:DUF899 domain-containing protein n=1 Tax=Pseudorhodoplanes sp. TaxID=1934341 RepID=UPI002CB6DFFA|nr:thioredoxin family protein [Pseudorhodoplanes sp.]HWV40301.1 thioredoxin family protein [Pseudorhodoplanes sp.]
MTPHRIVSRDEWTAARRAFMAKEKELMRKNDALSEERRSLPWLKIEKDYVFECPNGRVTLADLFGGNSQLIVYHFMLAPNAKAGCSGCSYFTDQIQGASLHLPHHDVSMALVSRAPWRDIAPFKKRMGWTIPWISSHGTSFNRDFGVQFTPEEIGAGRIDYNFGTITTDPRYMSEDLPGISVFFRDQDGSIYLTYSAYARGLDTFMAGQSLLDITPKGRNERTADGRLNYWVRHHDSYEEPEAKACCA